MVGGSEWCISVCSGEPCLLVGAINNKCKKSGDCPHIPEFNRWYPPWSLICIKNTGSKLDKSPKNVRTSFKLKNFNSRFSLSLGGYSENSLNTSLCNLMGTTKPRLGNAYTFKHHACIIKTRLISLLPFHFNYNLYSINNPPLHNLFSTGSKLKQLKWKIPLFFKCQICFTLYLLKTDILVHFW